MKFASFGRARDIQMLEQYVTDPVLKERWVKQTLAAHDLNDGLGTVEDFIEASREAIFQSTQAARDPALTLLARIAFYYPQCLTIWDELAQSPSWSDRFTVACRLYWGVPEKSSNRLFNLLRHDKSKRVREIALDRYKHRADDTGTVIFNRYDPDEFDDRVRRGEVKI